MAFRSLDREGLWALGACACLLLLGCSKGRDLDELGIARPDGGIWYLETPPDEEAGAGGEGNAGEGGSGGSAGIGTGSGGANGGSGAGTAGGGAGRGGTGGGTAGAGTAPPIGNAGSNGFPGFPGGGMGNGGRGGGQNTGGGSNNTSACAPCDTFAGSLGDVPGCCTQDNQCGSDLRAIGGSGCVAHDQPGTQSNACPQISIMMGGFQIPGCCRANGQCGVMITMSAPLGCIDPSIAAAYLQFDGPVGPAQPCRP